MFNGINVLISDFIMLSHSHKYNQYLALSRHSKLLNLLNTQTYLAEDYFCIFSMMKKVLSLLLVLATHGDGGLLDCTKQSLG